jgi:hypothetical protein
VPGIVTRVVRSPVAGSMVFSQAVRPINIIKHAIGLIVISIGFRIHWAFPIGNPTSLVHGCVGRASIVPGAWRLVFNQRPGFNPRKWRESGCHSAFLISAAA